MALLTIRLLGNPQVKVDQQVLSFRTRKVLALLIYLVVEGGMHSRESLMALLWPESSAKDAAVTLRVTLSRLRKSLQPAGKYLLSEAGKVGFDFAQPVDLDLTWLATAVHPNSSPDTLTSILEIDQGEFLAGFSLPDASAFENWATVQRELCQRQIETIYDRLTQQQLAKQHSATAVTTTARWLTCAPLSELPYRRLMAAQALVGDRPAALKTYNQCRAMLQKEFNIEPARETVALAETIRDLRFTIHDSHKETTNHDPQSTFLNRQRLPFVGRANEHGRLVASWRNVKERGASVVAVIGDAGVGKTRLVDAFQEWVTFDSSDVGIWQGRAFEMGGHLPYQPVIDALRVRLEQENAPEDLLDDVWLAELSQLMPELRARYPDLPQPMIGEANFVYARLFAAVATLGSALAARHPAILVLDDMQWADSDTLDMVHYVTQHWAANEVPILLLLTVRQENIVANAVLREWFVRLGRDVPMTRLQLDSLNEQGVQEIVAHLAAPTVDDKVADAFSDWLWTETSGLPFFIEALLQMLIEESIMIASEVNGRIHYDFAPALSHVNSDDRIMIPPSVREAILVRLERLSEAAEGLLLSAAVLGRECSFERLCQVANLGELDALEAIELLLNGRLLIENSGNQRPYMLAHDYIREVVYSKNREARRRIYHRRALIALEADRATAIECAFHALASRLDEPALRLSLAAGDEALRSCAFQESIVHFERAWEVAQRLDKKTTAVAPQTWLQLYQKRGRALELANEYGAAQTNYQEMLEMALVRQDQVLELAALIAQCIIHATSFSPLFNTPKARELGLAALDLALKLGDSEAEVMALRGLTSVELNAAQDKEKAVAYGEKALALARELGLQEQVGYMLGNLTIIYLTQEQFEAARKSSDEAQSIWRTLRNLPMLADAYAHKMGIFIFTGAYKNALACAHEALQLSQSIGNLWHQRMAHLQMAIAHIVRGQFDQAFTNIDVIMSLSKKINDTEGYTSYGWTRFYLNIGTLQKAEQWANTLYAAKETLPPGFKTFFIVEIVRVKIALGNLAEGAAILQQAYATFDKNGLYSYAIAPLSVAEAHLQLALGKPDRALAFMEELVVHLHAIDSRYYLAEAMWLQAQALLIMDEMLQAKEAILAANAVAEINDERVILWQILATFAEIERKMGNDDQAEKLVSRARKIIKYIADNTGTAESRTTFLTQPMVVMILG